MFELFGFFATIILIAKAEYTSDTSETTIITTQYTHQFMKVNEHNVSNEITWIVDVDEHKNPIKISYYILRRINGEDVWKLASVDNLCSESDNQVTRNRQKSFLNSFANSESCPIKMGSKAVVQDQSSYPVPHASPICGPFASKTDIVSVEYDIIIVSIMHKGNVTGVNC